MKNGLSGFGWYVVGVVFVTVVATIIVGATTKWYNGIYPFLGGFAVLCISAAITGGKGRRK